MLENDISKQVVPFTQIANEVLNSRILSFKAKGIYSFMMSKPNGWNFTIRSMAKQVKDGEDGIRSGLRELRELGCIVYVKHQNGTGTYHLKTVISSVEKPKREKPVKAVQSQNGETPRRENPLKGKSTRISNKEALVIKIQDSNKDIYKKPQSEIIDEFYPNETSATTLRNKYLNNITKTQAVEIVESFKDAMRNRSAKWKDIQACFRTYIKQGYVKPTTVSVVNETKDLSYHDIGKIIQAEKEKQASAIGQLANNMRSK
jgi:hypothetical protein